MKHENNTTITQLLSTYVFMTYLRVSKPKTKYPDENKNRYKFE